MEADEMTAAGKRLSNTNSILATEIRVACKSILVSDLFQNSPRMCRLLKFLVDKALEDAIRDTSEYAIGIGVFDRNPSLYNTGDDPIVRVQIGRLRTKLRNYYASSECRDDIEVMVPLGSYMPTFKRRHPPITHHRAACIAIYPFRFFPSNREKEYFVNGLYDELMHRLYKTFGSNIVAISPTKVDHDLKRSNLRNAELQTALHCLEGSIHIDEERCRTSVRLINVSTACIVWSEQFNRNISLNISQQAELASSICNALEKILSNDTGISTIYL